MVIKNISLLFQRAALKANWPCIAGLSSCLKRQPRYELHEAEGGAEVSLHSHRSSLSKTCDWLFRRAGKSYHLNICKWADEDKIQVIKFLAWGHQLITSGVQGKNLPPQQLPEESRADADTCYRSAWSLNRNCCSKVGYKLCRRFPPSRLHLTFLSWAAKAKQSLRVPPTRPVWFIWACQRYMGLPFMSDRVAPLLPAQPGCPLLWF